ncbi:PqiC family protein [Pelagicoccus mobilis]|uniref:Membrane integrity-associated transporter subunit PqiC n=1 Tax=Pelagicoccus mobilis TaxID=415221 RepID=A0A934S4E1_9BACT|nr:PqiC family protein [Pelagicoccus mobilis]MBK1879144.1 membrane integrity-associated transporter subunit PqiC [Pelagicoccus mobilis]
MKYRACIRMVAMGVTALLLSGCLTNDLLKPKPDTTRFYALEAEERASSQGDDASTTVVVNMIRIPKYLDYSGVVTQLPSYEMRQSGEHRWSEPLDEGIARVLVAGMASELEGVRVSRIKDRPGLDWDYRVGASVEKLDGDLEGEVKLQVRWWISVNDSEQTREFYSNLTESAGVGYEGYVGAINRLVKSWSVEVSAAVQSLEK